MLLGFVAATAIVRGVFQIVAVDPAPCKVIDDEWVLGLSGVLSIVFGVLLLLGQRGHGSSWQ